MKAINPATEELIYDYPETSEATVAEAIRRADDAFIPWRRQPFSQRAELMRSLGRVVRSETEALARINTLEAGKPIAQAEDEVDKCAWICDYYAEHADGFLAPEQVAGDDLTASIHQEPLGPLLAIMPWNFPFWQVFRALVPAMVAGNVALVKHASNVPGTSLAIGDLFGKAGFPEGVLQVLLIGGSRASGLIGDDRIRAVTFTGSTAMGREVAAEAGRHMKKTVLELGGSDSFLVLADADIPAAARLGAQARTLNAGQSCTAAKRFLVEDAVADDFEEALLEQLRQLEPGDPTDRAVEVGPMARKDLMDELQEQVRGSVEQGAAIRLGGEPLDRRGFFYPPTLLAGVVPGMPAFEEETFGPVAAVIRAKDRGALVELANRSRYGLAATIATRDPDEGRRLAGMLETGAVFINSTAGYDPRIPMGGRKDSGYGRELGRAGIHEFVATKTVRVEP